jgi:hypothetical protein
LESIFDDIDEAIRYEVAGAEVVTLRIRHGSRRPD